MDHNYGDSSAVFRVVTSHTELPSEHLTVSSRALEVADCIFARLNLPYTIDHQPRLRAQQNIARGLSDGVLPMLKQPYLDEFATLTAPFQLEKWYWFSKDHAILNTIGSHKELSIGVLRGSNQAHWLENQGYSNVMAVESSQQLNMLLDLGRVVAVFNDLQWGLNTYGTLTGSSVGVSFAFERYAPLGLYVSDKWLINHPYLIDTFNAEITYCNPEGIALSPTEMAIIENQVYRPMFERVQGLPLLDKILDEAENLSLQEVMHRDGLWQQALDRGITYPLMVEMLNNALSKALEREKEGASGVISEMFVIDRYGKNAAISRPTSDYWQGDESKFLSVINQGYKTHFGSMRFDASTEKFLVQISAPIFTDTGAFHGVLVVGVDVVRALELHKGHH